MKQGKPKHTRQDAERLFAGLPGGNTSVSSRPVNPFEAGPFDTARRADDETRLWKDHLITLPIAIVLPAGYTSLAHLREAIVRALRVRWVRGTDHEVVAEFPEGWKAVRPATGPIELRDPSNVVRAVYGWADDAELRLLPRYLIETQSNSSSGMGSLLVRDRATGQILERSSIWSSLTGTNHPDWARLSGWLNLRYPQHLDPLRYWYDCEENAGQTVA
ncbi:hypothetical protein [Burkholderia stagnalis]|uniref:hypothetical protein n=1 Tax=Burkholderia stagnalis TaxID=1503054 RepID=UPI000752B1C5|nr:hypothetical protein [Burkholderia stagnalis]KVM89612.1 hypothetical protein WT05_03770 [Burkholderia stagnalis]